MKSNGQDKQDNNLWIHNRLPNNRTFQKLNADCGWWLFIVEDSSRGLQSPGNIQHPGLCEFLDKNGSDVEYARFSQPSQLCTGKPNMVSRFQSIVPSELIILFLESVTSTQGFCYTIQRSHYKEEKHKREKGF